MLKKMLPAALLAAGLAYVPNAEAAPDILRPSTNDGFFTIGVGPHFFGFRSRAFRGRNFATRSQVKIGLDLGWHLEGDGEGPALGLGVENIFDDFGGAFFYAINPSFKFWWDIQVVDDMAIYVTPFGKAGAIFGFCDFCRSVEPAANIGAGVEGRVVLEDRWMLFLRPVQLDTYIGDYFGETFFLGYSILAGGLITF